MADYPISTYFPNDASIERGIKKELLYKDTKKDNMIFLQHTELFLFPNGKVKEGNLAEPLSLKNGRLVVPAGAMINFYPNGQPREIISFVRSAATNNRAGLKTGPIIYNGEKVSRIAFDQNGNVLRKNY
jgi:antitoxin component YwqK of YwqJK toxin-antitoxin module